jgi:glycosyltransferase involved in cell wall biosynthesis
MQKATRVSVCMATYNGANFIKEQIESILMQLTPDDELIISDDGSCDDTVKIIKSIIDNSTNVFIRINLCRVGYVRNFEQSIYAANSDLIILSDQDDIWETGRLELMVNNYMENSLIIGNFANFTTFSNENVREEHILNKSKKIINKNFDSELLAIILGTKFFYGCTFLFNKRDLSSIIYPFPRLIISHDLWIALSYALLGRIVRLEAIVTNRRCHSNNVTVSSRSNIAKIITRTQMFRECIIILYRYFYKNYVSKYFAKK